jgi:hypothetical protein
MPSLDTLPWKDFITLSAALLGAGLGIMNTWNAMSQRRVRVRVNPTFTLTVDGDPLGFSIEVVNLSTFPLTIAEIGFEAGRGRRVIVQAPRFLDGGNLPRRLDSREAASALFTPQNFGVPPAGITLGKAYVRTACGRTIYGDSPARRQFAQMITEISEGR